MKVRKIFWIFPITGIILVSLESADADVLLDNFTGTSAKLPWFSVYGACLTARGNDTSTSSIPACTDGSGKGTGYYLNQTMVGGYTGTGTANWPDPVNKGALRLTNGYLSPGNYYQQHGAVVYNGTPFKSDQGVLVTFTTYTYAGDGGGSGAMGADGISFYLMDGSVNSNPDGSYDATTPGNPLPIGAWGGSLAYSCSNSNPPYNGLVGAYVGLGMDEYGNFLNPGDNTASGPGYQWNRIGLRGAGNVAWSWLSKYYPTYYPSNPAPNALTISQQQAAVQNTCISGTLWNYSNAASPVNTNATSTGLNPALMDYAPIPGAFALLDPTIEPIAKETATMRGQATPINYKLQATPITYKLQISKDSLLSLWYSYNNGNYTPVLTNQSITASNGPLPATLRFAFAGSTGGSNNVHEITCFQAGPSSLASSSAGINVKQSGEVKTGTQVFLAYYHDNTWWGQLTSQNLVVGTSTNAVSVSATANWDANCVLTGTGVPGGTASGTCSATGQALTAAQSARQILTWSGTNSTTGSGTPFEWSGTAGVTSITTAQQAALNPDGKGLDRLSYLRGDRSKEKKSDGTGTFRARDGVLSDIINSSPTWVGPPSYNYPTATGSTASQWHDMYATSTQPDSAQPENFATSTTYGQFQSTQSTRMNVVYDGANDGMMHGFRAGSYDSGGNYVATYNDGKEVIAYMPDTALRALYNATSTAPLNFSDPQFAHNYYVDATPGTGDLFYGGTWHTWLVGGLGAGGKAIYALDITSPDPGNTAPSNYVETNSKLVVGEWATSTLPVGLGQYLGQTYGTPQVRRFHNGQWGAVFGNGLSSQAGHAGIFIMLVDPSTGTGGNLPSVTFKFLDACSASGPGCANGTNPNGITFVTAADLDGDHITDFVYAGDVRGNIWRFDLTSSDSTKWAASSFTSSASPPTTTPSPLFSAPAGQPITTQVMTIGAKLNANDPKRVIIAFGTGQQIPATQLAAAIYATTTQSLYGIWDWNLSTWNSKSSAQYVALGSAVQPIQPSNLQIQTMTTNATAGVRTVSTNTVCYPGSTGCTPTNQYGWELDFAPTPCIPDGAGGCIYEQVIYSPIVAFGAFLVNTTIPSVNKPTSCDVLNATGWTMAVNPINGGSFAQSFFTDPNGNLINDPNTGNPVSGVALNAVGSPSTVSVSGTPYVINQTSSGVVIVRKANYSAASGRRITWTELR